MPTSGEIFQFLPRKQTIFRSNGEIPKHFIQPMKNEQLAPYNLQLGREISAKDINLDLTQVAEIPTSTSKYRLLYIILALVIVALLIVGGIVAAVLIIQRNSADSTTITTQSTTTATTSTTSTSTTSTSTTSTSTTTTSTTTTVTTTTTLLPSQCSSYTSIIDSTRLSTYSGPISCDSPGSLGSTPGWFRFSGAGGTMLPTSAVPINMCGTSATGWYTGSYPSAGSTTTGTVCYYWNSNTCYWSNSIQVTNCNGYYVFYLTSTPTCNLRYCTI